MLSAVGSALADGTIPGRSNSVRSSRPYGGHAHQAGAKLALARSFGIAPANRGIKVSGPYRLMRHPMYAGYLVVHIGVLLMMPLPMNLVIYAIGWSAQVRRILAEEVLLRHDAAYRAYMAEVTWRLIPGLF